MASAASMAFRCDTQGDRNASRLCFNGGVCQTAPSPIEGGGAWEFCVCPPGFSADFTLGHFQNCALPDGALEAIFAIITIACFMAVAYAGISMPQFRSEVRRYVILAICQNLSIWGLALCVLVEKGFYESGAVFLCLSNISTAAAMVQLNMLAALPIYAMFKKSARILERISYSVLGATLLLQVALTVCLIIFARDADPQRFNLVMVISQFISTGTIVILAAAAGTSMSSLKRSINSHKSYGNHDSQMETMVIKLKGIVKSSFVVMTIFTFVLCYPITWTIIKSFPGQYILFFFMFINTPYYLAKAVWRFRSEPLIKSSGNKQETALAAVKSSKNSDQIDHAASGAVVPASADQ